MENGILKTIINKDGSLASLCLIEANRYDYYIHIFVIIINTHRIFHKVLALCVLAIPPLTRCPP